MPGSDVLVVLGVLVCLVRFVFCASLVCLMCLAWCAGCAWCAWLCLVVLGCAWLCLVVLCVMAVLCFLGLHDALGTYALWFVGVTVRRMCFIEGCM